MFSAMFESLTILFQGPGYLTGQSMAGEQVHGMTIANRCHFSPSHSFSYARRGTWPVLFTKVCQQKRGAVSTWPKSYHVFSSKNLGTKEVVLQRCMEEKGYHMAMSSTLGT